jgi:hypothetical protein
MDRVAAPRLAGLSQCAFSVLSNTLAHWDAKERTHDIPLVTCPAATLIRDKALVIAGERIGEGSDLPERTLLNNELLSRSCKVCHNSAQEPLCVVCDARYLNSWWGG